MKVEEMERMLAEFYEGNTSEQEEELLKEYFRTEEVPDRLQKDKKLFLSLFDEEIGEKAIPAGLEDRISQKIDAKAAEEQYAYRRGNAGHYWRWTGMVAATFLLLVGIGYGITNMREDMDLPVPKDTFTNPEAAYKALQATLLEVSTNLNEGMEQLEEIRQDVAEVNREMNKEF